MVEYSLFRLQNGRFFRALTTEVVMHIAAMLPTEASSNCMSTAWTVPDPISFSPVVGFCSVLTSVCHSLRFQSGYTSVGRTTRATQEASLPMYLV